MLKRIFTRKKKSSQDRPNHSDGDIANTQYMCIDEGERCKSVEPVINPNYVLRERKNNDEIEISYYNTDTYINVDKKRPCYENLDNPPTSLKSVLSDNMNNRGTYDGIWHYNSNKNKKTVTNSRTSSSIPHFEACDATQIQYDQVKDITQQKWYFGYLGRSEAESKLIHTLPSTFLVRQSQRDDSYILSVKLLAGPVAHIKIEKGEGYWLQGSYKTFYTIGQLVTFFTLNEIAIKQLGLHQLLKLGLVNKSNAVA
ncbi:uncharacterized protein LOC134815190 [Bolinopsis microptera]|uniref:uncharacterized protein LOC134815190 n=1 Tax=Bolinopsis microptera TaxID=2820187 RepID=UPI00307A9854